MAKDSDKIDQKEKDESAKKRQSMLDKLEKNYDAELNGLMSNIESQNKALNAEKARQLQLAKLKRQRKMVERTVAKLRQERVDMEREVAEEKEKLEIWYLHQKIRRHYDDNTTNDYNKI